MPEQDSLIKRLQEYGRELEKAAQQSRSRQITESGHSPEQEFYQRFISQFPEINSQKNY
jgi:hypothetical protein